MQTMTDEPRVVPFTEEETSTDKENCAHIVKTSGKETASAKVLQARIEGLVLEALCGYKWVPSQDPVRLPVCQECKDIYETYKMFNDGLNDRPTV